MLYLFQELDQLARLFNLTFRGLRFSRIDMKQKDILLIVVPTFIMVVLWIAFSIYHNHVSSTIKDPLSTQIEPISATFDTKTLDNLKQRERLNPLYERPVSETEEIILDEEENIASPSSEASESAEVLNEES